MRRVAHPHMAWEDYRAGMYARPSGPAAELVDAAFELLTDPPTFEISMRDMLAEWPTAAEHYLTRPGAKSRAWLGAATCMWRERSPEQCTRAAWWLLTEDQKSAANAVADAVRAEWSAKREEAEDA